jgi:hypothetical protein
MRQAANMRVRTRFIVTRFLASVVALGAVVAIAPAAQAGAQSQPPSARGVISHTGPGVVRGLHRAARPTGPGRSPGGTLSGSSDTSHNWDGYIVTNSSNTNTTSFNAVSAQWTVPTVSCDLAQTEDESAFFWVGLDGALNGTVEQDGISAFCNSNHQVFYNTWYQMTPDFLVSGFSVNPGDTIRASVTYNTSTSEFDLVVDDVTLGQSLTQDIACQSQSGCVRSTAEVISEDPAIGDDVDGLYFLPSYGTVSYSNISVTDSSGHSGTLSDPAWVANPVTQVSSQGVTKQTTSAPSPDGSSFSTTWQYEIGNPEPQLYQVLNSSDPTTQIQFALNALNQTSSPIPLSNITIRYWFIENSAEPMVFSCDYAQVGCSNVTGTFVSLNPTLPGADSYLQIGFTSGAGSVGAGDYTGPIEVRAHRDDYGNITQADSYSYSSSDTSYTWNPSITVYDNGTLVYGSEP